MRCVKYQDNGENHKRVGSSFSDDDDKRKDKGSLSDDKKETDELKKDAENGKKDMLGNDKKDDPINKIKKGMVVGKAVDTGIKGFALLQLLAKLKLMLQGLLGAIQALAGGLWAGIMSFASMLAQAIGVGIATAVAISIGGIASIIIAGVILVVSSVQSGQIAVRDERPDDCTANMQGLIKSMDFVGDLNENAMENAKKMYSILSKAGMVDEKISAIFGNVEAESGFDPTKIENIYVESFAYGPVKATIDKYDFVPWHAGSALQSSGLYKTNWKDWFHYFDRSDHLMARFGIGIWQLTDTFGSSADKVANLASYKANPAGKYQGEGTLMRKFIENELKLPWYSLEGQMIFVMTPPSRGGYSRHDVMFEKWTDKYAGSPEVAADYFREKWLVQLKYAIQERRNNSAKWFVTIKDWEVDEDYANSVLDQIANANYLGDNQARKNLSMKCEGFRDINADNSSLVNAFISYAWPTREQAIGNIGTDLYVKLHNQVIGDGIYKSCDRGVCVAIRWAGVDDKFPPGAVVNQRAYMEKSDKWKQIPWDYREESLHPGDIMLTTKRSGYEHIMMYLGKEAIKHKYPNAPDNYSIGDASYGQRSAGLKAWGGSAYYQSMDYVIFRFVGSKETSSKYKGADTARSNDLLISRRDKGSKVTVGSQDNNLSPEQVQALKRQNDFLEEKKKKEVADFLKMKMLVGVHYEPNPNDPDEVAQAKRNRENYEKEQAKKDAQLRAEARQRTGLQGEELENYIRRLFASIEDEKQEAKRKAEEQRSNKKAKSQLNSEEFNKLMKEAEENAKKNKKKGTNVRKNKINVVPRPTKNTNKGGTP